MPSSGMIRRVALVRTDASEERRFEQEPQGVTSRKMASLISTAVKCSNLTQICSYFWDVIDGSLDIIRIP
jgi:hypothetical protein